MSQLFRVRCPSASFAICLADVLTAEGAIASYLVTDDGPVVLTHAPAELVSAACAMIGGL